MRREDGGPRDQAMGKEQDANHRPRPTAPEGGREAGRINLKTLSREREEGDGP